jgi:hypothetical protein
MQAKHRSATESRYALANFAKVAVNLFQLQSSHVMIRGGVFVAGSVRCGKYG